MKMILIINGPIASGKNTIARKLAEALESLHTAATCFDMDDKVFFIDPIDSYKTEAERIQTWNQARKEITKEIVKQLKGNTEIIILSGPFFYKPSVHDICRLLGNAYPVYIYTLYNPLIFRLLRNMQRPHQTPLSEIMRQWIQLRRKPISVSSVPIFNIFIQRTIERILHDIQLHQN